MVAWGALLQAGPGALHVRTVAASTGLSAPRVRSAPAAPSTCRDRGPPARGQFFAAWYTQPNVYGRTIAADGSPIGGQSLLAYNYATYDGLGLSYNPAADAYFAVFHGRGREDAGAQIRPQACPTSSST